MLKKLSEKLGAKFPATIPSCSMVKISNLGNSSLNIFYAQVSPEEGQSQQQKENQREKSEKKKTFEKSKSLKPYRSISRPKSQNFDFCACLGQNVLNTIPVERTASCRVANAFSTRLKLIWPRSSLKITKMSKKRNFGKKFQMSMG